MSVKPLIFRKVNLDFCVLDFENETTYVMLLHLFIDLKQSFQDLTE